MAIITPPPRSLSSLYRTLYSGPSTISGSRLSQLGGIFSPAYTPDAAPTFNSGGQASAGSGASANVAAPDTSKLNFNIGDFGDDPIVGRVKAAVEAQTAEANARAEAARNTQLIRFGDPAMVNTVLGKKAGNTAQAASDNPFSTVADLNTWNNRSLTGIDETRNQQNLFYSTTRARDRSLQQESALRAKAKASSQLQDVLNQISQDVINVRNQGLQQIISAEENAYNRKLQQAIAEAQMRAMSAGAGGGSAGGGGGTVVTDPSTGAQVVVPSGGGGGTIDFVNNRPPASIGGPGGIPE